MADNQKEKIQRLVEVRQALNLNQDQMARILGIPRTSLSKIENARDNRDVPYGTKHILQLELDVNPDWLERGDGPMFMEKAILPGGDGTGVRIMRADPPEDLEESERKKTKRMSVEEKLSFAMDRNQEISDKAMAALEKNVHLLEEISKLKDLLLEKEREIFHIKSSEKNNPNDRVGV